MITTFLLKGLLIGFSIGMTIGPIALLCISRTLERGRIAGLAIGLGAAAADGVYGLVAGFGLTFIINWLTEYEIWIRFIGGIFLLYLGIKTFLPKPISEKANMEAHTFLKSFFTTFLLTLTSPMTILVFMAIFASLGVGSESRDYVSSSFLVLGVFLGSASFYFILTWLLSVFRSKISDKHIAWGNKLAGIIIGGFGISAIVSLI